MNVFDAIKGTIANVPQNISAGFKSLTRKESTDSDIVHLEGIEVNAGADLLNHFQGYWAELHQNAEVNAEKAQMIDSTVNKLYLEIERDNEVMNEFLMQASLLPELVGALQASMDLIGEIESKVSELENRMLTLEDLCDQQELLTNRQCHRRELKLYKQRRAIEIEQMKAQLAQKHADNVAQYESQLQENLRDKHSMFEDTYSQAIKDYKVFGATHLKTPGYMAAPRSPTSDLTTINLEQDTAALDEFLQEAASQQTDYMLSEYVATVPTESDSAQDESKSDQNTDTKDTEGTIDANSSVDSENKTSEVMEVKVAENIQEGKNESKYTGTEDTAGDTKTERDDDKVSEGQEQSL